MEFYAISDVGKCRTENQDSCGSVGEGRIFFATVCDGMGGAAAGRQAAEIAIIFAVLLAAILLYLNRNLGRNGAETEKYR